MRSISLKKKMILFIGATVVAMVAIVLFVFVPTTSTILRLTANITQTEQYLEDQYKEAQNMQESIREIDTVAADIERFNGITVERGRELTLITQLEDIAEAHGIDQQFNIRFVDNSSSRANGMYLPSAYYQFSFLNHGAYSDHLAYLRALELLPQYVTIQRIMIDRRSTTQIVSTTPTTLTFEALMYASPQ